MIVCVDLGGTAVKLALMDADGQLHARREIPVNLDSDQAPLQTVMLCAVSALVEETGAEVEGAGISATGQIDSETGTVIGTNGAIPGYEGAPLGPMLQAQLGRPVAVLNDANAALLGEMAQGAARGVKDALMVTLGTGVGGAFACGGRLMIGQRGLAGEIGHMPLHFRGIPCTCGRSGCYERYASTAALVRKGREATGDATLDGRALFARAEAGDETLLGLLSTWREEIAAGLIGLIHLLNPEMVVIGGGVSRQRELLMKPLRALVLSGVMPCFARSLRVEAAELGNDAGLIGAALWFRQRMESQ